MKLRTCSTLSMVGVVDCSNGYSRYVSVVASHVRLSFLGGHIPQGGGKVLCTLSVSLLLFDL